MTTEQQQMADAVRAARDAVTELEEPLKTEAFKILLEKLLAGRGEARGRPRQPTRTRGLEKKVKVSSTRQQVRPTRSQSSLQLDVGQLKSLKAYCERFDLQGTEQTAFILANFAREHTNLEFVTAADIEYLYRQLVSQRAKVLAVNDSAAWARALNWLAAPSRRKEWLVRSGNGHAVSNSGLLRFHQLEEEAGARSPQRTDSLG